MKLAIPKPVVEHDLTHAEANPRFGNAPSAWDSQRYRSNGLTEANARNPDYTDSGHYPSLLRQIDSENMNVDAEVRRLYLDDCKSQGFELGCVVVHTRTARSKRIEPLNWGFVISYNTDREAGSVWTPVRVRWANGSYEDCHTHELKLMIHVPDKFVLIARATRNEQTPHPL